MNLLLRRQKADSFRFAPAREQLVYLNPFGAMSGVLNLRRFSMGERSDSRRLHHCYQSLPPPLFAALDVALRVANLFKCENRGTGKTRRAHRLVVDDVYSGDADVLTLEMRLTLVSGAIVRFHGRLRQVGNHFYAKRGKQTTGLGRRSSVA
jgi:hypothetical protein